MYSGHSPIDIKTNYLSHIFLKAHGVTDSTEGYEPSGPGANPGGPKSPSRGLDCSCVIMKVGETRRVYVREPVTIHVMCDSNDVNFNMQKVNKLGGGMWACDIGPMYKPLTATMRIDNQTLPIIVTE